MEGRLYDLHLSADHPTRGSAGPRSAPRRERHAPYAHDGRPLVHVYGRAVDEVAEYSLPNRTCDRRGGNRAHLPRRPWTPAECGTSHRRSLRRIAWGATDNTNRGGSGGSGTSTCRLGASHRSAQRPTASTTRNGTPATRRHSLWT